MKMLLFIALTSLILSGCSGMPADHNTTEIERIELQQPVERKISPEPLMPKKVQIEKQELHDNSGNVRMEMQEIHEAE